MKLKYIERAAAIIVLLGKIYGLFLVADSVWRGIGWSQNYHGPQSVPVFFNVYFFPQVLSYVAFYISFVWLVTGLPYRYVLKGRWRPAVLTAFAGFMVAWIIMSLGNFLKLPFSGQDTDKFNLLRANLQDCGRLSTLYAWLVFYIAVKHLIIWLWGKYTRQPQYIKKQFYQKRLIFDVIFLAAIWALTIFLASFLKLGHWAVLFALLVIPCFFLTCLLNLYWLIPVYYKPKDNRRFWLVEFIVTLVVNLPLTGIFCAMGTNSPFMLVSMFIIFWVGQLALSIPATYLIHRRRTDIAKEVQGLKTNLNTTEANLDMLRAQINPHFLFNALNSLYGMALIEQAEKTGEGIQLLGDMMRFMLHENNREQIALNSEIGYLKNYLALQNMRIASSPDIKITMDIAEANINHNIAPMLLVPFVENAYKHGISFKEPSWIHISLAVLNWQLQFDVRNSIHPNREADPERHNSGIGLENVKQRLQLLYPGKHNLVIRKTETEFSIYLNLQLK